MTDQFVPFMESTFRLMPFSPLAWDACLARLDSGGVSQEEMEAALPDADLSAAGMVFGGAHWGVGQARDTSLREAVLWRACCASSAGAFVEGVEMNTAINGIRTTLRERTILEYFAASSANAEHTRQYAIPNAVRRWTILPSRALGLRLLAGLRQVFGGLETKAGRDKKLRAIWNERLRQVDNVAGCIQGARDAVLADLSLQPPERPPRSREPGGFAY